MYKLLTFICIFAFYVDSVYSAQSISRPVKPPQKFAGQPGCYDPETDTLHPPGISHAQPGEKNCYERSCRADGSVLFSQCGVIHGPPGCDLVEDFSKPYPDCCPKPGDCS